MSDTPKSPAGPGRSARTSRTSRDGWPAPGFAAVGAHTASGDRVVVVTASEANLARAFLDALGLRGVELVATQVRGRSAVVHNRGDEKVRQLAARGVTPPWHVADSDSLTDLPMLAGARHDVWSTPSHATARARAVLPGRLSEVRWQ